MCSTQGKSLIEACQGTLQTHVPPSFDVNGIPFNSGISADGNLGPATLAGIVNVCQQLSAPLWITAGLMADFNRCVDSRGNTVPSQRNTPLSWATMNALIWLAAHPTLPPEAITVPHDIVPVRFAVPAPDDGSVVSEINCVLSADVTGPSVGGTSGGGPTPVAAPSGASSSVPLFVGLFAILALAAGKKGRK